MRFGALSVLLASSILLATACDDNVETGDPNNVTEAQCVATFRVLQKDAYKETAGRTTALWPPHTTTLLEIACDGEVVSSAFQANHGTEPGQVDANGDVFLVEVGAFEVEGSRAELEALKDAYSTCSCDSETTFLSLDSLDDTTAQALMETVTSYLEANMTCTTGTPTDIVAKLSASDVEGAIDQFLACTWSSGASFEEGLDLALSALAQKTGELLSDYHVCNNDAALQKELFDGYAATGEVKACDATAALCHSPTWLYTP